VFGVLGGETDAAEMTLFNSTDRQRPDADAGFLDYDNATFPQRLVQERQI
jgi:hypothetical protein